MAGVMSRRLDVDALRANVAGSDTLTVIDVTQIRMKSWSRTGPRGPTVMVFSFST